jgi:hypothetical protein
MWALPADRKILLDILGPGAARHLQGLIDARRSDVLRSNEELLLLWGSKPEPYLSGFLPGEHLPEAIVVHGKQMREFTAWVTMVVGGYRPFTAFFRIIDRESVQRALEFKEPSLGRFDNALAGLIMAEALTLSATQRSVSALSLLPCESTYCYSFARALAVGYVATCKGEDPISAPLALARRLTRQPARRLEDGLLSTALKVVSGLAVGQAIPVSGGVPAFIWEACRELQSEGEVKQSWDLLGEGGAIPTQLLNDMRGPREQRVRTFERILNGVNQLDVLTSSFLVGLLADQIGPGTFEHIDLLLPYLNQYPMALVWYGLCAGLHPDSEVQQVGNCLGRRLVRDLLASDPISSYPKYDIAVSELEVYLDREEPLEFRAASQNHIAVELLPGVPAYMKWPVVSSTEPASVQQREISLHGRGSQRELPLKSSLVETASDGGFSTDRQSAIRDLESAVQRVKLILKEPNIDSSRLNEKEGSKRRKKH